MTTHLQRRWGGGGQDPTENELRTALAELDKPDAEHPACWLSNEDGWTVAAHCNGTVVLENIETGEGPWHMVGQTPDAVLYLWRLLQAGELDGIRKQPWLPGYE
jgi:hypothetical protein